MPRDSREERRRYENDVFYEVWRAGGNPDAIDYDRVDDTRYAGQTAEETAASVLQQQRTRREALQAEREAEDEAYREAQEQ